MDNQALIEKVKQHVEDLREELIWATSRILMFETVSGAADEAGKQLYRQEIAACAKWLESLTLRMGFRWLEKPGRWYCIEWPIAESAKTSKSAKPVVLGIPAHIDVVPASGQWKYPPFSGTVAERIIWGRGTQDDKGPLVATLYGLYALKLAGFVPPATYRIIIGTQEEIGDWSDIYEYLAEEGKPDFGFTPDADFPLIIGEKGMLTITASYPWTKDFAEPNGAPAPQTPAPAGGEIPAAAGLVEFVSLHGGTRANIVPDLCEWTLRYPAARRDEIVPFLFNRATQFTVEHEGASITIAPEKAKPSAVKTAKGEAAEELLVSFLGKSAHGSTPEKGHNAILDALAFLVETQCAPASVRAFAQFLVVGCSDYLGNALNIASRHDFVGATTVSLGVAHFDANGGEALLNLRPTLGLSVDEAADRVAETTAAYNARFKASVHTKPHHAGSNAQYLDPAKAGAFLRGLQDGFKAATGLEPALKAIGGTTYAKAMPNCCAFGPVMTSQGEQEMAHQANENVPVDGQVRNAKIYGLGLGLAGLYIAAEQKTQ